MCNVKFNILFSGIFLVNDFWTPPLPSKFVQILQYSFDDIKGPYGWLGHVCLAPAGGPKARDGHHVSA